MEKIKTEQPYKLLKVLFKDKSTAKTQAIKGFLITIVAALIMGCIFIGPESLFMIPLVIALMAIMYSPLMFYNPKLGKDYVPKKSFGFIRKLAKGEIPAYWGNLYKDEDKLLRKFHSDVDCNTNLDLYELYGVNDKLILSYQNFDFNKQNLEDGDYLLGVSAQGLYCVSKKGTITKTKINFDEIVSIGLLFSIFRPICLVLQIRNKRNEEINAILYVTTSVVVHPFLFIHSLFEALDSFIENGGAVSSITSRRRRASASPGANTGTGSTVKESQEMSSSRTIDISYSAGVLEEIRTATYVGSNRQIEIDNLTPTMVVNEDPVVSRSVDLESSQPTSNRNIDLDDLISSRIADARKDFIAEVQTPLVQPSQAKSEMPQTETPKEETPSVEVPRTEETKVEMPITAAPLIEEAILKTPNMATPPVEEQKGKPIAETPKAATPKTETPKAEPIKTEEPQKNNKTGLIIGIIAGVIAIAAVVLFFVMKGNKEQALAEQQAQYEMQMQEQQAKHEAELEEQRRQQEAQQNKHKEYECLDGEVCESILNRLYNDYVFGNRIGQFAEVVDEMFTKNAKQKLIDAYDYDCDGVCYGIWALRTSAQDSKGNGGKSRVESIVRQGCYGLGPIDVYEVSYEDMGWRGSTLFAFVMDNGKVKIDDFIKSWDENSYNKVENLSKDELRVVVDNEGNLKGQYSSTIGNYYEIDVQDRGWVPISGHHIEIYSAKNGQGVIYTFRTNVNVRQSPTTSSAVIAQISYEEGMCPETYPCLGKENGWYKINIDGKIGYVREDMVEWDYTDRC